MDIVPALDIATRFVAWNERWKTWEEPIGDGRSIEITSISDAFGNRTCVDLVAYPSNEVLNSRSVEENNKYEIALAIMEIMNEGVRV